MNKKKEIKVNLVQLTDLVNLNKFKMTMTMTMTLVESQNLEKFIMKDLKNLNKNLNKKKGKKVNLEQLIDLVNLNKSKMTMMTMI